MLSWGSVEITKRSRLRGLALSAVAIPPAPIFCSETDRSECWPKRPIAESIMRSALGPGTIAWGTSEFSATALAGSDHVSFSARGVSGFR